MAVLFDTHTRIVPTFVAAARHLALRSAEGYQDRNLILEIADPLTQLAVERQVMRSVDLALRSHTYDLTLDTVGNTIFPQGLYRTHGRPDFYAEYKRIMVRARKRGTWGTYFGRVIERKLLDGGSMNPLDEIVEKFKRFTRPGAPAYQSAYELSTSDTGPVVEDVDLGCELATYDAGHDSRIVRGGQCLSHLSFKLTDRTHVDLTAVYRSHHYCSRGLGNLLGLARLMLFVATEAGLSVGTLTCVSTHAELDLGAWGGVTSGKTLLASM